MPPKRYQRKPVVVEAVQWDGTVKDAEAIMKWLAQRHSPAVHRPSRPMRPDPTITVNNGSTPVVVAPGEWLVHHPGEGREPGRCEKYDATLFESTFEAAR